jgi:4-amino-4-deoxy-L-arabinose transferase-like glycosyltransferase
MPELARLEPFPGQRELLSPQAQARWFWTFLVIGVSLRLVRYALRFPLWEDEAGLSANLLDRGYRELLQPLNYNQIAPTLFLWGQLTVVRLLGFSEYTLRLVPFLCSMGSLLLFGRVARQLLRGATLVLAVGLFAVSYPLARYAAEAKPYACDLFLALAMLALVVEWLRGPGRKRWLWALAAIVGPAVGYSYSAVFVAGGISLAVAYRLWRSRRGGWLPWAVFNLVLAASFAALMIVNRSAVSGAEQQSMDRYWVDSFPPLAQPWKLPVWFLEIHCGGMLGYPLGGPNWGSLFSFLLCLAGAAMLVRRRQGFLLAVLLAPLALNFVAAAMHRYPYGGHSRMTLFMAPAYCILIGLGMTGGAALAAALRWRLMRWANVPAATSRTYARAAVLALLGFFLAVAAVILSRDLWCPYKSGTTLRAKEFAQWFWSDLAVDSELVCLETDLKANLSPGSYEHGLASLYLCNQRIYSPRHARGEPPRWDRVSAERPLRCVLFRSTKWERDAQPLERWLDGMRRDYRLVARDKYPAPFYDKSDRRPLAVDFIEVFKFVPKGIAHGGVTVRSPSPSGRGTG